MPELIVFIGDSLTEWYDWQGRFPSYRVANLGISGETVKGLLARRERIRLKIADPAHIFLMTGINNISTGQYDIEEPYREIVRNLTTWYKEADIVVQSILPEDIPGMDYGIIVETNRQLERIAGDHGARYLDLYRSFVSGNGKTKSGYLDDDGVHLTGRGYAAWADAVERSLQPSPPTKNRKVTR